MNELIEDEGRSRVGAAKSVAAVSVGDTVIRVRDAAEEEWRLQRSLSDPMFDHLERTAKLAGVDDLWGKEYRRELAQQQAIAKGDGSPASAPPSVTSPAAPGPDVQAKDTEREASFAIPESLRKRYLQAENKFYFRDEAAELAFEDKGRRLATEHNDPDIAKSMVELADAKGWTAIKLKGTDEFKREAWLHASLHGMEVKGYKPKDVDLARLADRQVGEGRVADRPLNSIERSVPMDKEAVVDEQERTLSVQQRTAIDHLKAILRERGDSEQAVDMAAALAAERFQTTRVYVGKIAELGQAPYENNKDNEMSYFVALSDGRKVWGVDLGRAVAAGDAKVGDAVAIAYQGKQEVIVPVKKRDEEGNVIGEAKIVTHRNTWEVTRLDKMREDVKDQLALRSREGAKQPEVRVFDRNADRAQPRPDAPLAQPQKEREPDRARS